MKIRTPKLIVMLITAFAIGGASIVFQSIIHNTIVTPCLLGMNSLYTLIHTAVAVSYTQLDGYKRQVYWSGTGNTEAMAMAVAEGAKGKGAEVSVITAAEFSPEQVGEYLSLIHI